MASSRADTPTLHIENERRASEYLKGFSRIFRTAGKLSRSWRRDWIRGLSDEDLDVVIDVLWFYHPFPKTTRNAIITSLFDIVQKDKTIKGDEGDNVVFRLICTTRKDQPGRNNKQLLLGGLGTKLMVELGADVFDAFWGRRPNFESIARVLLDAWLTERFPRQDGDLERDSLTIFKSPRTKRKLEIDAAALAINNRPKRQRIPTRKAYDNAIHGNNLSDDADDRWNDTSKFCNNYGWSDDSGLGDSIDEESVASMEANEEFSSDSGPCIQGYSSIRKHYQEVEAKL